MIRKQKIKKKLIKKMSMKKRKLIDRILKTQKRKVKKMKQNLKMKKLNITVALFLRKLSWPGKKILMQRVAKKLSLMNMLRKLEINILLKIRIKNKNQSLKDPLLLMKLRNIGIRWVQKKNMKSGASLLILMDHF